MKLLVHDYSGYSFQFDLSRELARRGHDVTHAYANVLASPRASFTKRANDSETLEICTIPMDPEYEAKKYRFFTRFLMNMSYLVRISKCIWQRRPEYVLSGNAPTEIQLPLVLLCKFLGIRFGNWIQDFYSLAVASLLQEKLGAISCLIGAPYRWADQMVIRLSDVSIPISEDFCTIISEWGIRATAVAIPNWSTIESIPICAHDNSFSRAHGLTDKFCFIYSGTLGLKHDGQVFLTLAQAFTDDPSVRVVVVAEGAGALSLRAEVAQHGLQNLVVLPYQPVEALPNVLGTADVLIAVLGVTAGRFSVPSKVLTYFCGGRPILLSMPTVNLVSRVVLKHKMGFVSEPGDTTAWVAQARQLHADATLREKMGARARSYAEENFPISKVTDRFASVLGLTEPTVPGAAVSLPLAS